MEDFQNGFIDSKFRKEDVEGKDNKLSQQNITAEGEAALNMTLDMKKDVRQTKVKDVTEVEVRDEGLQMLQEM